NPWSDFRPRYCCSRDPPPSALRQPAGRLGAPALPDRAFIYAPWTYLTSPRASSPHVAPPVRRCDTFVAGRKVVHSLRADVQLPRIRRILPLTGGLGTERVLISADAVTLSLGSRSMRDT